jgi:5-methylcytosine-specific restriction endonuclease McrA
MTYRRAMRACANPRCPNLTTAKWCASCDADRAPLRREVQRRKDLERLNDPEVRHATEVHRSPAWTATSKRYREEHPICENPHGWHRDVRPSTEVHHIVPIAHGGAELDESNLMALCAKCHKRMEREDS